MWPDRVSNPGPLTYESGALPTALRGPTQNETNLSAWYDFKSKPGKKSTGSIKVQCTLQISENNTNVTQNSYRDPGVLLIWIIIEQGPTSLTVGAGWFVWTFLIPFCFSLSPKDGLI